jgi:hypothetical protein
LQWKNAMITETRRVVQNAWAYASVITMGDVKKGAAEIRVTRDLAAVQNTQER